MCSQLLPHSLWTSLSEVRTDMPASLDPLLTVRCLLSHRRRIKRKLMTREIAVYMENIHSTSSPGVRVYMDSDPQLRFVEPTRGQSRQEEESRQASGANSKGSRAGVTEKLSPRVDSRIDADSSAIVLRSIGDQSRRAPVASQQQRFKDPLGNQNEVSRSQVISSQSFPVSLMSRGGVEKYVFVTSVVVLSCLVLSPVSPVLSVTHASPSSLSLPLTTLSASFCSFQRKNRNNLRS